MLMLLKRKPGSGSSDNLFVYGRKGLRFRSTASQIRHSAANASPQPAYLKKKRFCLGAIARKYARKLHDNHSLKSSIDIRVP